MSAAINCLRKVLPQKVCFCLPFEIGIKVVLGLVLVLRFICMVMGCFYGPYIYLTFPLGGLYLAADAILIYAVTKSMSSTTANEVKYIKYNQF